mmetsp:Transcript_105700/g.252132  ORF Transcript_105700/g.252132 Transcript_105700/m.252132 type:complete len:306 (+) Transcript_105700:122-1039(+)
MFCSTCCCGGEIANQGFRDDGEADAGKTPSDGRAVAPTKRADEALADDTSMQLPLDPLGEKGIGGMGQAALGRTLLEEFHGDGSPSKNGVSFSSASIAYNGKEPSEHAANSSGFLTTRSLATTTAGGCNPEFQVIVERAPGSSLGLNLDALDGQSLIISAVKAGPVRAFNEKQDDEDNMLQCGDSIVEVNGARGSSQGLLEHLKVDTELILTIKRPISFTISIARAYAPLGLQVEHAPNGTSLLVKTVNPGLIKDWNLSHRGMGIKRRDRVITVNGSQGNPAELMAKMKMAAVQGERLDIEVCRY